MREFEEEAIVDLLARTSEDDVADLLIESDRARICAMRSIPIRSRGVSKRFSRWPASSMAQNLRTQLTNIFTVDAAEAVASGKRTQEERRKLSGAGHLDRRASSFSIASDLEKAISDKEKPGEIAPSIGSSINDWRRFSRTRAPSSASSEVQPRVQPRAR